MNTRHIFSCVRLQREKHNETGTYNGSRKKVRQNRSILTLLCYKTKDIHYHLTLGQTHSDKMNKIHNQGNFAKQKIWTLQQQQQSMKKNKQRERIEDNLAFLVVL
jgi:hypothetical protein